MRTLNIQISLKWMMLNELKSRDELNKNLNSKKDEKKNKQENQFRFLGKCYFCVQISTFLKVEISERISNQLEFQILYFYSA